MLVEIANATADSGERVSVCVTRSNVQMAKQLRPTIAVQVLNRQQRFETQALRVLGGFIRQQRVDLLHLHSRSTLSLVVLAKTLRLIPQSTQVLFQDHYGIEIDETIPRWLKLWGWRFVDQYVGVYDKLEGWAIRAGIPPERVCSIPNALDFKRLTAPNLLDIRREFNLLADMPVGVLVGSIRPVKRVEVLLEALAQQTHPFQFLIVGAAGDPTYYAGLRAQAVHLGLHDKVHFTGGRADIPALLRSCDFGVLSSDSESGPLVLIEYMAAHLPVVATLVGGISKQTAHYHPEIFVPPNDVAALAKAINCMLKLNTAERRANGEHLYQFAVQQFDLNKVIRQWQAVYDDLLASQGSSDA